MTDEIWKSLKGVVVYGDKYQISSLGRVRNVNRNKLLLQGTDKEGYKTAVLGASTPSGYKSKKYRVHRLVASVFIPKIAGKDIVNHKDLTKDNNCADNLEWVTNRENIKHAIDNNPEYASWVRDNCTEVGKAYGRINGLKCRKKVVQYNMDGSVINTFDSIKDASRLTGTSLSTVHYHCKEQSYPRSLTYYFRYA